MNYRKIGIVLAIACMVVASTEAPGKWEGSIVVSNGTGQLHVSSARCLASAIYTMWRRYGLPLTYEDAPLRYEGDLVDVTAPSYKVKSPTDRAFDPRGGALDVLFDVKDAEGRPVEVDQFLSNLLNAYKATGFPGVYKVVQDATGTFHIIPESTRDAYGNEKAVAPLMDCELAIPQKPGRTNKELIDMLVASLTAQTGAKVVLGKPLPPIFENDVFPDGFPSISARAALEQAFYRSGGHRFWMLLWDPTFRYYVLSIF